MPQLGYLDCAGCGALYTEEEGHNCSPRRTMPVRERIAWAIVVVACSLVLAFLVLPIHQTQFRSNDNELQNSRCRLYAQLHTEGDGRTGNVCPPVDAVSP